MNGQVIEFERLESLGLSLRVENCLRSDGMWFVYELCERTEAELRTIRGMGNTSIREIREALARRGLALAQ